MSFHNATIMFVVGLIAFAVLFPVAGEIIVPIQNTMGGTVAGMIGAMLVIIMVTAIILYYRMSIMDDNYLPPEAYDY